MRRFLLQVGIFFSLQLTIFFVLAGRYGADAESYYAAVNLKHDLLEAPGEGRIVLVGGSSVAFGFDSRRISEVLGRPCMNMALHAGLGLEFMLREVEPHLRKGDWVVLSPEYGHFFWDQTGWDRTLLPVLEQRPSLVARLSPSQFKLLGDTGLGFVGSRARQWFRYARGHRPRRPGLPYTRAAFNGLGDVVGHHNLPPTQGRNVPLGLPAAIEAEHLTGVIRLLNRFASRNQARGVQTYFCFAPLNEKSPLRQSVLADLERRLRDELQFPVIAGVDQMVLPIECFYDTTYHLTADGAVRRSRTLVDALNAASR